jgi:hypothetical protein
MIKLLLPLMLILNGAGWPAANGATPADADPPAHHESSGTGDCCDEEIMNCECGCTIPHLAGFGVPPAVRGYATPTAPAHCPRAHHPLSSWTTPFRPPA